MTPWVFLDFVSVAGNNQIAAWSEEQSAAVQADLEMTLGLLSETAVWTTPQYKPLKGTLKGYGEIRFKTGNVQYRVIGFLEGRTFTMLIGCTHKQGVYKPHGTFETAVKRRKQLEDKEASTCDHYDQ